MECGCGKGAKCCSASANRHAGMKCFEFICTHPVSLVSDEKVRKLLDMIPSEFQTLFGECFWVHCRHPNCGFIIPFFPTARCSHINADGSVCCGEMKRVGKSDVFSCTKCGNKFRQKK